MLITAATNNNITDDGVSAFTNFQLFISTHLLATKSNVSFITFISIVRFLSHIHYTRENSRFHFVGKMFEQESVECNLMSERTKTFSMFSTIFTTKSMMVVSRTWWMLLDIFRFISTVKSWKMSRYLIFDIVKQASNISRWYQSPSNSYYWTFLLHSIKRDIVNFFFLANLSCDLSPPFTISHIHSSSCCVWLPPCHT